MIYKGSVYRENINKLQFYKLDGASQARERGSHFLVEEIGQELREIWGERGESNEGGKGIAQEGAMKRVKDNF